MARVSLQNMAATKDPLQTWNWEVVFPRIPGAADSRILTVRATATAAPGSQIEQAPWEGHGRKLNFAGRRTYTGTWDCTFVDARDSSTFKTLSGWADTTRPYVEGKGAYKEEYATTVEVTMYDAADNPSRYIKLRNCFITNIADVSLDQSSTVMTMQVTLSFDWADNETPAA